MKSEEDVHAAIDGLNGKGLGERTLKVNRARPRDSHRNKRSSSQRNSKGGRVWQSRDSKGKYQDHVH